MHLERPEHASRACVEHAIGVHVVTVARELELQLARVDRRMRIATAEPRGHGRIVRPRADAGQASACQGNSGPGSILRCGAMSLCPTTRVGGIP